MHISPGTILISSSNLQDPNFEKAVIVITEYNANGATGFVINKIFPRRFNELEEFKNAQPFILHTGGPVDTESLFMLHQKKDMIEGGTAIANNIYMGGDFKQAVALINNASIDAFGLKLFIGYCGWDAGELDAEIAEGSWIVTNESSAVIFTQQTTTMWDDLITKYSIL